MAAESSASFKQQSGLARILIFFFFLSSSLLSIAQWYVFPLSFQCISRTLSVKLHGSDPPALDPLF